MTRLAASTIVACASASILFGMASSAASQSPQALADAAKGGQCPAQLVAYNLVDANAECNPGGRETRACDSNYKPASRAWQSCYDDVMVCRRKVDDDNVKILNYNLFINKCRAARDGADRQAAQDAARMTRPARQGTDSEMNKTAPESKWAAKITAARRKAQGADETHRRNLAEAESAQASWESHRIEEEKQISADYLEAEQLQYQRSLAAIRAHQAAVAEAQWNEIERERAAAAAAQQSANDAAMWSAFTGVMLGVVSGLDSNYRSTPSYSAPSGSGSGMRCRAGESMQRCTMR